MSFASIDSGMGGYAQSMLTVGAQDPTQIGSRADGSSAAAGASQVGEAVQVAMLQKALENERSMVNILA